MIISISFSKPDSKAVLQQFQKPYIKIRILKVPGISSTPRYQMECFTEKQAFQSTLSQTEAEEFYKTHAGTTFKNAVCKTESEEITTMANRHGEIKTITKKLKSDGENQSNKLFNRKKNYIINEGEAVPFLVKLGVMTEKGQVVSKMYDKFRQINRFLEYVDNILDEVLKLRSTPTAQSPLTIADFGCGKSYLTFAIYHYLWEIKSIPVKIVGLDLKEDVINHCNKTAAELGWENLTFHVGDVAKSASRYGKPDIMITLHACDTATDYALEYALKQDALAILSVPCCQHELNLQLKKNSGSGSNEIFNLFTKYGILKERFCALATDAVRANLLEQQGYSVQLLEFIDMEGTPKNLLIRAVKDPNKKAAPCKDEAASLLKELNVQQTLYNLLSGNSD